MTMPDREGRWRAYPVEWSVQEIGDSKLCTLVMSFKMSQWYGVMNTGDPEDWQDWTLYGEQIITGYFFLEKKDRSPNEFAINSLKDALGWDGLDVTALQNADWSQVGVQLTLENDTYQGKTRLKVKWLNTWDSEGGGQAIEKSDAPVLSAMQARLGSKLRAIAGPVSQNGPAPTGRPAPPAPPAAQTAAAALADKDIPFAWALLLLPTLLMMF
ncbi:MAG: hypothetical protein IIB55_01390 [Planctomycetes bacterium]|nr:hypothetical protein [Planctomycetota bacterium]